MRLLVFLATSACVLGCGSDRLLSPDGGGGGDGPSSDVPHSDDAPPGDAYKAVFDSVSQANLEKLLREMTGADPVTVGTQTFQITNRWSKTAKEKFRSYWTQYFTGLGATVQELAFSASNRVPGEAKGHNLEAVLPGASADSIVIIVHYDTVGEDGKEEDNPGADDDGTGLATQMEAARIFSQIPDRKYTVRFVAADYEELTDNEGGFAYVEYLQQEAAAKGFQIVVASDNDQTGWSCWDEDPGLCTKGFGNPPANSTFKLITCATPTQYNHPDLATGFLDVASTYSTTMNPTQVCDDAGDTDHYPFWVAGIPAYVLEEWGVENNPHYDDTGHDVLSTINMTYFWQLSQIQITYQARLMGIGP